MATTSIEWTRNPKDGSQGKVWNPCTGCNKISAGCKNCYAEGIANRFWGERKFTDVQCHEDRLEQPLHWRKPAMIFVNSMSDLFHPSVPFEFIDEVFHVMAHCQKHIFQVLTKRPERMLEYFEQFQFTYLQTVFPFKNVWAGVSVENQKTADERIPLLLETPAAVRFLSIEPMLEKVDLTFIKDKDGDAIDCVNGTYGDTKGLGAVQDYEVVDWVIVGAESGFNRRPCQIEWIENIVEQCKNANVPVFVKQININGKVIKDMNLFPEHLRIQEYPNNLKV